jgi:ankyrin repeat protein
VNIIRLIIEKEPPKRCGSPLSNACRYGHENIAVLLLEKYRDKIGKSDLDWALRGACKGGHEHIVRLIIENGGDNFNQGLIFACQGGHEHLVRLMIQKGANNFFDAINFSSNDRVKQIILDWGL